MGKISQDTIEQILAANDIVDVIGSYFPLKRAGSTYKALCPFHQEKSPSFTVNPQRQIFKCFGCGAGGSVVKFVEMYESVPFPEALKRLAQRAGIAISEEAHSERDDQLARLRRRLLALHHEAAEWFHRNLMRTTAAQSARDYLKKRGITAEIAKSWKIGYAPDAWELFSEWAREQKFANDELLRSGLVKPRNDGESDQINIADPEADLHGVRFYDRFRGRIMFPICNDLGEVIAFSGRTLSADPQIAKYLNSPETMLFTKGNALFGLHKSKRALIEKKSAIVCEGQLDLISAFEAGICNVVAPQGTAFTAQQARILKRYVEEVVLCFDADAAGQKAAERSLAALLEADLAVRVAQMPANHDPDSLIRDEGAAAFEKVIADAKDFFDFQIDAATRSPEFQTPRGKLALARKLAGMVALIRNAVLRDDIVHKIASQLEISSDEFRRMLRAPAPLSSGEMAVSENDAPAFSSLTLSKTLTLLCQIALQDAEARRSLQAQDWREMAVSEPNLAFLEKLLSADIDVQNQNSINAFLIALDPDEEAFLSGLLLRPALPNPLTVIRDCRNHLLCRALQRQMEILGAKLRTHDLPPEKIIALQKEVLDLQKRVTDIARLSSNS